MNEKSLKQISLSSLCAGKKFYPSPVAWEDQVLYFLMLDRFSDNKETAYLDNKGNKVTTGFTPPFNPSDANNAVGNDADADLWREAGGKWVGGTLDGLESKIGYLSRLGVSAVWISPLFKQISFQPTYHGYGIQNFLDVDPHFGTRADLKRVVKTAHSRGVHVILDIILNHTGNVFSYDPDRYHCTDGQGNQWMDTRWDGGKYSVKGFNDKTGNPVLPFGTLDLAKNPEAWPNGAIWPMEFQDPATFTCKGYINNWDYDPEFYEGDFCDLKDVSLGSGPIDSFVPSRAMEFLCEVYKFWIAYADLDGFRIDTVKHMHPGAVRYFASVIHEFCQSIGKENFYLIGEITGGRERAFDTLELTGLDAALGVDDVPDKLEYMVKGYRNPADYFNLFRNSMLVYKESHVWFRNKVVTMFDDHDQVRKGKNKARFCADSGADKLAISIAGVNLCTLGIPCIYYGSEQCFDGHGDNDRYLREAMFGGAFGAFASRGVHFFNEQNSVFIEINKIIAVRAQNIALRRGRQYLRPISGDGINFGLPAIMGGQMRSLVPWSRILDQSEILCSINTDTVSSQTAWVTIDSALHETVKALTCLYSTDPAQIGTTVPVELRNGKSVKLMVPAHGFVIFK